LKLVWKYEEYSASKPEIRKKTHKIVVHTRILIQSDTNRNDYTLTQRDMLYNHRSAGPALVRGFVEFSSLLFRTRKKYNISNLLIIVVDIGYYHFFPPFFEII
jgi:hypothetical protein